MAPKPKGRIQENIDKAIQQFLKDGDFTKLLMDIHSIGDNSRYAWHFYRGHNYIYGYEYLNDVFKHIIKSEEFKQLLVTYLVF